MKYIATIAVISILLLQFFGAVPQSSVGGPMTLALVFFAVALAIGVYEAWTNKRSILGWIVSIVTAVVGAFLAAEVGNLMMGLLLPHLNLNGSLAQTQGPLLYIVSVAMLLLMLLGSWIALSFVERWR
ncbi:MAG: hypothetical protein JSR78_04210 [Proteobacteria bacterium]|nr:hypothetical protein [Pseudomonadota bacterium]